MFAMKETECANTLIQTGRMLKWRSHLGLRASTKPTSGYGAIIAAKAICPWRSKEPGMSWVKVTLPISDHWEPPCHMTLTRAVCLRGDEKFPVLAAADVARAVWAPFRDVLKAVGAFDTPPPPTPQEQDTFSVHTTGDQTGVHTTVAGRTIGEHSADHDNLTTRRARHS